MDEEKKQLTELLEIAEYMVLKGSNPYDEDNESTSAYSLSGDLILKRLFDGQLSYNEDFLELLGLEEFTDTKIKHKKCHKLIVETRTGKTIGELNKSLGNRTKEEIEEFLLWVYGKEIEGIEKKAYFSKLAIAKRTLRKDISRLYETNETKDFTLIVHQTKIKVHKLILLARSGLFKGLFISTLETKQVQDFTNKSVKTLEALIKFLYTNKLDELNQDNQILEELLDAQDYYQLNPKSMLRYLIEKKQNYSKN
ncbi:speckle-type poz protein [Anaeramoeba flamelloides]|uniref:Speckle-type poz protein n=1 Tax=Anaeramoeba flamelloides TaxID=1746091 RepID=A0AAV7YLX7_9EUKA|nr:speckle-type poz protein [Anaeramoeba flamelloides]